MRPPRSEGRPESSGGRLQRERGWQILESAEIGVRHGGERFGVRESYYASGLSDVVPHLTGVRLARSSSRDRIPYED
jgi:hypothetical protein